MRRPVVDLLLGALCTLTSLSVGHSACLYRASVNSAGEPANGDSWGASISADGKIVAFVSSATNLWPGDTNGQPDVFVHNRTLGTTVLVSHGLHGAPADGESGSPAISSDGLYIAFKSSATNLVPNDWNRATDVFLYNRVSGKVSRVSVRPDGTEGNGGCWDPCIGTMGAWVAFATSAANLVAPTPNGYDVVCHDCLSGTNTRVAHGPEGEVPDNSCDYPNMSPSGKYFTFRSFATNLVPGPVGVYANIYLSRQGVIELVSRPDAGGEADGPCYASSVSENGTLVAFEAEAANLVPTDPDNACNIYAYRGGTIRRVSVRSSRVEGSPRSKNPSVSPDGRFIAYDSGSNYLVPSDTNLYNDVFLYDWKTGKTELVSVALNGSQPSVGNSENPSISADGSVVAFESQAPLVPEDSGWTKDIYLYTGVNQADLMISYQATGGYVGDGIYGKKGKDQTCTQSATIGVATKYFIRVQNDGPRAQRFRITGARGNAAWQVRYFAGATSTTDITPEVTGSGRTTPSLQPQETRTFRVEVTPRQAALPGSRFAALVQAEPATTGEGDAVKLVAELGTSGGSALVTGLAAAPTPDGAQIVFGLSGAADVTITVLNLAGRPVRTVTAERPLEGGRQTLVWDRRSEAGLRVPAGTYLVQVLARGEDGAVSRGVATVALP